MRPIDEFMAVYTEELRRALATHPDDYLWPESEFDAVVARMRAAIERGSMNKNSAAFRATCKRLGIKHTYKAIAEFVNEPLPPCVLAMQCYCAGHARGNAASEPCDTSEVQS